MRGHSRQVEDGNSQGRALLPPLPPGEGGGEGSYAMHPFIPHPNPLPEGEGTKSLPHKVSHRERKHWRSGLTVLSLTGFVMVCFVSLALGATTADQEARVREIASQLRCPICQGLSVGDSPSELANEMRTLIREQLQQGKTSAEVLDYFAQRYGEWILLAPPKHGFNLVIWVLPFVLLPVGAAAVYVGARRWVRKSATAELPSQRLDSPYAERLQRELDSYQ
jgi:cytochrome c-type biogenesis protein CcmH